MERIAVVTGASRGLGSEIARLLAEEGFSLVLGARDVAALEELATQLRVPGEVEVVTCACDVTSTASVEGLRDAALAAFGRVDILVANAGIGDFASIVDTREEAFQQLLDVNVLGVWRCLAAFAGVLAAAPSRGLVLLVSSDVSARVFPGGGPYVATKHAVRALARTFQQEHPELRVCELRPGSTRTSFNGADPGAPVAPGSLAAEEVVATLRMVVTAPDDVRVEEVVVRSAGQAPDY